MGVFWIPYIRAGQARRPVKHGQERRNDPNSHFHADLHEVLDGDAQAWLSVPPERGPVPRSVWFLEPKSIITAL